MAVSRWQAMREIPLQAMVVRFGFRYWREKGGPRRPALGKTDFECARCRTVH